MSNQTDHTIVRLRVPPELKEKIQKAAEENNRSQRAEMVDRLEKSFVTPEFGRMDGSQIYELLEKMVDKSVKKITYKINAEDGKRTYSGVIENKKNSPK